MAVQTAGQWRVYLRGWAARWSQRLPGRLRHAEASASHCPDRRSQTEKKTLIKLEHCFSFSYRHGPWNTCSWAKAYITWTKSIDLTLLQTTRNMRLGPQKGENVCHLFHLCSSLCSITPLHPATRTPTSPLLSLSQCSREQSAEWGYKQMSCDCNGPGPVLLTPGGLSVMTPAL